ncbi:hypothetical protein B5S31_g515 [[Candida] boidinii]|nr:hypothetical protein B5S31_g515 [[Candida] boidinii]
MSSFNEATGENGNLTSSHDETENNTFKKRKVDLKTKGKKEQTSETVSRDGIPKDLTETSNQGATGNSKKGHLSGDDDTDGTAQMKIHSKNQNSIASTNTPLAADNTHHLYPVPEGLDSKKWCQFCGKSFKFPGSLGRHLDLRKGSYQHPQEEIEKLRANVARRGDAEVVKERRAKRAREYNRRDYVKEKNRQRRKLQSKAYREKENSLLNFLKNLSTPVLPSHPSFPRMVLFFLPPSQWPHDPPTYQTLQNLVDFFTENEKLEKGLENIQIKKDKRGHIRKVIVKTETNNFENHSNLNNNVNLPQSTKLMLLSDCSIKANYYKEKLKIAYENWQTFTTTMKKEMWVREQRLCAQEALGKMTLFDFATRDKIASEISRLKLRELESQFKANQLLENDLKSNSNVSKLQSKEITNETENEKSQLKTEYNKTTTLNNQSQEIEPETNTQYEYPGISFDNQDVLNSGLSSEQLYQTIKDTSSGIEYDETSDNDEEDETDKVYNERMDSDIDKLDNDDEDEGIDEEESDANVENDNHVGAGINSKIKVKMSNDNSAKRVAITSPDGGIIDHANNLQSLADSNSNNSINLDNDIVDATTAEMYYTAAAVAAAEQQRQDNIEGRSLHEHAAQIDHGDIVVDVARLVNEVGLEVNSDDDDDEEDDADQEVDDDEEDEDEEEDDDNDDNDNEDNEERETNRIGNDDNEEFDNSHVTRLLELENTSNKGNSQYH